MRVDNRFKNTEYVVEADSFARQALWAQWSTEALFKNPPHYNNMKWEQDSMGRMETVGHINNNPVCVEFYWVKLNGHLILFYDACSNMVDHKMVETWVKKYCSPRHDGRLSYTNADNFHHVIEYIKDCEAQRLINEAQAHADEGNPDDAAHLIEQCWSEHSYTKDKECQAINYVIKGMKGHPGANLPKRKS